MPRVLIVEDEHVLGKTLRDRFNVQPFESHWCTSAESAVDWLSKHQADLALVDLRLPGMDGLSFLERVKTDAPQMAAVVVTAHGDVGSAVRAMKLGAYEFLTKPFDLEALVLIAERALEQGRLSNIFARQKRADASEFGLDKIIGECEAIVKAKELVARLGKLGLSIRESPPTVLIQGETGTGKDLFARALHQEGPRSSGPFVHINCAALPEALMESELFGHVKGAFTDAKQSKKGMFELADEGTLFLNEVGLLPLALQAKLLTALETRRIRAVGALEEKPVNIHLISACNEKLHEMLDEGKFRQDLYHRLRVIHLELPPLRERDGDLDLLVDRFLAELCERFRMAAKQLTPEARRVLAEYSWPGNIRELRHWLESAVLLSEDEIGVEHLPQPAGVGRHPGVAAQPGPRGEVAVDFTQGGISLENVERRLIDKALEATGGNVSKAAELLGLSRDTLRYRIGKYQGGGAGGDEQA
jgi:two-component system response regulator AtoC